MIKRTLTILILLLLVSLACSVGANGNGDEDAPPSNVLFQDDFSDVSSGWDRYNETDAITDYANGVYRMYVNDADVDVWANPNLNFNDVHLEVDATKVGGADDNDFGLICRYQDAENFYFMVISSDGYYGIGKLNNGEQILIGDDSLQPSEDIEQGNTPNHLRADCVGSKLSLYANGHLLAEVEDTDFASGDVGLLAGTYEIPGTDIHFDNFTVLKP